ncbi:MAG: hypothetical protein FWD13_11715 [Treponema sp.]|nr:hypothetical protein [Treponema sp.]
MNKKAFFLFIILTLVISGSLFAQNAQELRVGAFISGNLNHSQEIWYSVRPTEAGILTVETMGDTDTYLEAYTAQRVLIMENDDGGENTNAKISIIVTANTTYLFKLRGFSSYVSGPYRIFAALTPMPAMTELRLGTVTSGNLGLGQEIWYRVRATTAGIITVETTSDIDTYLEAFDENLQYITHDDDSGEGLNAKIEINVAAGKTYYFKLTGFGGYHSGPFRILASHRNYPTPTQLRFGFFHSGTSSYGEDQWFSIRTTTRGRLLVETTGLYEYMIEIYNDSYDLLNTGYYEGAAISVEANRTYIIKLRDFSGGGNYRLFVSME